MPKIKDFYGDVIFMDERTEIKKFYDTSMNNPYLTVYWINCRTLYVKPASPASPQGKERMECVQRDIEDFFPGLEYTPHPGNMLRVETKGDKRVCCGGLV